MVIKGYELQGKPWTHCSAASSGEFNQAFLSDVAEREGGLIVLVCFVGINPVCVYSYNPSINAGATIRIIRNIG